MPTLGDYIQQRAAAEGVDPRIAFALIMRESGGNPAAIGDRGAAVGLGQLHQRAAIEGGISPEQRGDPAANVDATLSYLAQQLDRGSGNYNRALSFYNQGPNQYNPAGVAYGNRVIRTANQMPIGASLDDVANELLSAAPEEPAQGDVDLDTIADELLAGAPERDWGGAIPIDPSIIGAPDSGPQGSGGLTRDLVGMATMGFASGQLPLRGVGLAMKGIKAAEHWSRKQPRGERGRWIKEAPEMETTSPDTVPPSSTAQAGPDIPGWAPWLAGLMGHPHLSLALRAMRAAQKMSKP